ncbi:two-component system activity regulator YycH [Halobacillus sp. A1]|uniref:YycH family regulatory protein n=1 Tax=Halobacillus sp. A1 TaxID=2880262 RepID=UPI0020A67AEC|nr:two-component system activity regulator YycH [Halobacillus sp. A1]MCP3032161.1 two-component system activity regulator YycH [Halobacillus sp. A1]
MKVETLKSIILVILIGFSLLLTVGLWYYQPEYESAEDGDSLIDETSIEGEEVEISSLIEPDQFIFHLDGAHYSFRNQADTRLAFNDMRDWTLSGLTTTENREPQFNEGNWVELSFPTRIPSKMIPELFNVESENEVPSGQFNRMFITYNPDGAELMFTSDSESSAAFRASIGPDDADQLADSYSDEELLAEQTLFAEDEDKRIYIPKDSVTVQEDSVETERIDILPLKNELFPDSPVVNVSEGSTSEQRLTDNSRRLETLGNGNRMEYTKLTPNTSDVQRALNSYDLLERSVNFINTHEGWTDTFRLSELNPSNSSIVYNMYFNDIPLLSSADDVHRIRLEYDGEEEQRYVRPLRDFDPSYPNPNETELPSGEDVAAFLEDSRQYNVNLIEDIKIGYTIAPQSQNYQQVYDLIPVWFVKENGSWKEINELSSSSGEGGVAHAVGTN